MQYKVIFDNGTTSDLVDLETINRWVGFGRVRPWTILIDVAAGRNVRADQIETIHFPGPGKDEPISIVADVVATEPYSGLGSFVNAWACFIIGFFSIGMIAAFFGPGFFTIPFPSLMFLIGIRQSDRAIERNYDAGSLPRALNILFLVLILVFGALSALLGLWKPIR